jgi:hypothetical protein
MLPRIDVTVELFQNLQLASYSCVRGRIGVQDLPCSCFWILLAIDRGASARPVALLFYSSQLIAIARYLLTL